MVSHSATPGGLYSINDPAVKVNYDPRWGRGYVASRDFAAGDTLLVGKPFVIVPDLDSRGHVCAGCVRQPNKEDCSRKLPYTCLDGCGWATYCSEECRAKDWKRGHQHECKALKEMDGLNFEGKWGYVEDYARLVLMIVVERCREIVDLGRESPESVASFLGSQSQEPVTQIPKNTFSDVWTACTNASSFGARMDREVAWVGLIVARFVALVMYPEVLRTVSTYQIKAADILPEENDAYLVSYIAQTLASHASVIAGNADGSEAKGLAGHPLLSDLIEGLGGDLDQVAKVLASSISLTCREECNSFGLYNFARLGSEEERQGYAGRVFTSPIFFNHSCSPTWVIFSVTTRSRRLSQRSLTDAGDELCISYVGAVDEEFGLLRRRKNLKETFFFDCGCERCRVELLSHYATTSDDASGPVDTKYTSQLDALLCQRSGCKGFYRPGHLSLSSNALVSAAHKRSKRTSNEDAERDGTHRKDSGASLTENKMGGVSKHCTWQCEACGSTRAVSAT
ncbi:hypothetical protein BC829DRAFT_392186 [Chytridium lagenaria]|nr:hypothetical protein BC829DRAFT_392186 [Chytridium lagenaria]